MTCRRSLGPLSSHGVGCQDLHRTQLEGEGERQTQVTSQKLFCISPILALVSLYSSSGFLWNSMSPGSPG